MLATRSKFCFSASKSVSSNKFKCMNIEHQVKEARMNSPTLAFINSSCGFRIMPAASNTCRTTSRT